MRLFKRAYTVVLGVRGVLLGKRNGGTGTVQHSGWN